MEARTGYGGGYNERGVVEYRRREPSSDDEYDEFGRKKRKRKADSEERERLEKVCTNTTFCRNAMIMLELVEITSLLIKLYFNH